MNKIKSLIVLSLPLLFVSCSLLPSNLVATRDKQYLSAKSIPPLKIPPGIASSSFHSAYPVSDRHYPLGTENVSLVPPGLDRG